jgi:hypothetical protein
MSRYGYRCRLGFKRIFSVAHTPKQLKDAVLELLKHGAIESSRKPNVYRVLSTQSVHARAILEPLGLSLRLDEVRGLAFLYVPNPEEEETEGDEWAHPLVRRQRLNLEQSLLIAILRQQFILGEQENGLGHDVVANIEEILPQLHVYLGELGSEALEDKRIRNLLEQLRGHGLVSELDEHDRFTIRPLIVHLANPENLQVLIDHLKGLDAERSGDKPITGAASR